MSEDSKDYVIRTFSGQVFCFRKEPFENDTSKRGNVATNIVSYIL